MSFVFDTNKLIPVTGIDVYVAVIISTDRRVVILASSLLMFVSGALHCSVLYLKLREAVRLHLFGNITSLSRQRHIDTLQHS